ncbi:cytochrome P450 CYP749A22-like protein [Gossypium australe]|uniref:Cytochrome P450 CYP749A22-like protein n=1 Tax=Gossypium australe TaxID=47621 RepID=A0A5B6UTX0_9ROSI|nr:cytochrome P450 CYP749A22-like protein [Gossypium australe]
MNKRDRFGLEYKPDLRQNKRELEKKQEKRRARLSGREVKEEPMTFPHKSKMFVSGEIIYLKQRMESPEGMLGNLSINAIFKEGIGKNLSSIQLIQSNVQNALIDLSLRAIRILLWKMHMSSDINDMSDTATDSESLFKQDMV